MNGMAQPIFPYTTGEVTEGYSNDESDIIRYCVYVETNYDTDDDGKLDLVKALVQIPRAAMEGNYKAATIYEARPYITGCNESMNPGKNLGSESYDISKLYSQPDKRVPAGTATTADAAAAADSADWYYWNPYEQMYDYEDLNWYDYYLVRGFAVVECGGLGTKGSDGFETCGTDLEIDAFKCVIEWLHGDRVAYTDKTSNVAISADWSSGKIGMTGRSYAGTTQFGLATTGVAGLETIVPVAGIASWYEYTNSQGISTNSLVNYSERLGWYCNGRYLDPDDYATIAEKYGNYMYQIQQDQLKSNGDYSEHWATRDYTLDAENIKCPALIVHGLNDDNVRTKEFDLMWVFIERDGDSVLPVSLELCSETRRLCDASGEKLVAVIVGSISDGELQRVLDCGVDKVIHVTGTGYDYFNNDAYTNLFTVLCRKYRPTAVMVGGTINGRDFAPRFAARLGTGCTSDATELVWDPKTTDIEFVEPAVGGKMMAVITVPVARPQVGTIRPGTFKCVPCGARAHEVIEEHIDFPVADIRTEILDFRADDLDESLNIADADVIVCIGNAIKGADALPRYRRLAERLGGKLACTRPVFDRGVLPFKLVIGQSGAVVKPKLLLSFGVSGAVNHVTGFSDADVVVAVNTDPEAAIFNYCTYGIVGDMDEVCEAMLAKLGE